MRIVGNDPTLSRQLTATASGAISAAGKSLIVNTDGTVTETGIDSATQSLGSAVNFESGAIQYASATFDSNSNRVVIAYRDAGNSNYGTAVVGTISGTSVSYGTAVVFESAETTWINATFDSSNNKVVISYLDAGNSNYGTAIVGTVDSSDNSISFGSATVFNTAATNQGKITFDSSNNKVVIAYNNGGDSGHGYAIVGTVSGTSISFGSAAEFENAVISDPAITFDTDTNKVIIAYRDEGNSNYGTAIVGTVSGTSISYGSASVYHSVNASETAIAYDSNAQRIIVAYNNGGDNDHGYAVVGTVSGTGFSGFGTPVEFRNADEQANAIVFDSNANNVVVAFREDDDSNKGKFVIGTVATSGNTVTFDASTLTTFESGSTNWNTLAFDSSNNKVLIAHGGGSTGRSLVLQVAFSNENLTTENFIGTSAHSAADGAKVLVNTQGAIDENQSGLTAGQTFFVDKNGDLKLTTNDAQAVGTAVVYETSESRQNKATFDSNSNRVVIAYRDQGNSAYGTAVVGTVSGTSISFGTPVVFESANCEMIGPTFDSSNNKVVIAYVDNGNSGYETCIVGTVDPSDNSISFGTPAVYYSASGSSLDTITFDSSNNKVVVAYRVSSTRGEARVGTVSGTDITFGTAATIISNSITFFSSTFDTNSNKVVIVFMNYSSGDDGTAIVGTVSGTDITFGTPVEYSNDGQSNWNSVAFDSSNNKVIVSFSDGDDGDKGKAVVGTVSGTDISFGSIATYNDAATLYPVVVFDSSTGNPVVVYQDAGGSNYGRFAVGTVSGTNITFASEVVFEEAAVLHVGATFDSTNNRVVAVFEDDANSDYGTAVVIKTGSDTSGSLSTDAVPAGTALSATKLLVKG